MRLWARSAPPFPPARLVLCMTKDCNAMDATDGCLPARLIVCVRYVLAD